MHVCACAKGRGLDVMWCLGAEQRPCSMSPDSAALALSQAALMWKVEEGDYRDDITAIVLYLKGGEEWEQTRYQTL